jgi:tetraacyldisaccharide 4'-kinase
VREQEVRLSDEKNKLGGVKRLFRWSGWREHMRVFEAFAVDVIYGRDRSARARLLGGGLRCLSVLYALLVWLRGLLYRWGILRAQHLGCLVVVVGNLTVGGTGKTPVVERLARTLQENGRKVGILRRGYKSRSEPFPRRYLRWLLHQPPAPPRVVSDGKTIFFDSEVAGDEPYMLARNLPGVVVVTDKDRVKAGLHAIRQYGVDTLILDDGFQYYQLKDHLQLLLIDKTNPFGNGALLPRGILREPVSQMARASYVFLTKSEEAADPALVNILKRYRPDGDWIECAHRPKYFDPVGTGERHPLDWIRGKRVGALSGIAMPESFEGFLRELGAVEVVPFRFLDHHRFEPEELDRIVEAMEQHELEALITTEKDAVRIDPGFCPRFAFYFLRVEVHLTAGAKGFEEAVRRVCFPAGSDLKVIRGEEKTLPAVSDSAQ